MRGEEQQSGLKRGRIRYVCAWCVWEECDVAVEARRTRSEDGGGGSLGQVPVRCARCARLGRVGLGRTQQSLKGARKDEVKEKKRTHSRENSGF